MTPLVSGALLFSTIRGFEIDSKVQTNEKGYQNCFDFRGEQSPSGCHKCSAVYHFVVKLSRKQCGMPCASDTKQTRRNRTLRNSRVDAAPDPDGIMEVLNPAREQGEYIIIPIVYIQTALGLEWVAGWPNGEC